jgi:TM2 domain-containing membrane protein YozV
MDEQLRQQMVLEANRKSAGVAYVLWFFVGAFGAHRFYLDQTGSGIAQLLLLLLGWLPFLLGWVVLGIWLFIDLFLIPGIVRRKNIEMIGMMGGLSVAIPAVPAQRISG